MLIMLLIVTAIDLILIAIWLLIMDRMEKINGYKVIITPGEKEAAQHDINQYQIIKTELNGEELEVVVSKQLLRWGLKNQLNGWLMKKYIIYLALEAQERGKP